MQPLPPRAISLLAHLDAPSRLVAHLTLVHDAALTLTQQVDRRWPGLPYDRQAVLLGAATHDIGKVMHPEELTGPGHRHEDAGRALLLEAGFGPAQARFARTHGRWHRDPDIGLEDLLVALADTVWRGKRHPVLERLLVTRLAAFSGEEAWAVYLALDGILQGIAEGADARLAWHAQHPAVLSTGSKL